MPYRSSSINYVGGFNIQGNLTPELHWSADILVRRLRYVMVENPLLLGGTRQWVDTFQFPLLLRYTMRGDGVRPFVEGGPSLRARGADELTSPSTIGMTAGAGLFIPLKAGAVTPRLRYTRWTRDGSQAAIRTKPDQLEILVGFTGEPMQTQPRDNPRVMLGAIFGGVLENETVRVVESINSPVVGNIGTLTNSWSKSRWVGGPSLNVRIAGELSAEVNTLFRDSRLVTRLETNLGDVGTQGSAGTTRRAHVEVPVFAKYHIPTGTLRPYVLGGASFAGRSNRFGAQASNAGFTTGAGFDFPTRGGRIGGQLRYTRWGSGTAPDVTPAQQLTGAQLPRNELYLLFTVMR